MGFFFLETRLSQYVKMTLDLFRSCVFGIQLFWTVFLIEMTISLVTLLSRIFYFSTFLQLNIFDYKTGKTSPFHFRNRFPFKQVPIQFFHSTTDSNCSTRMLFSETASIFTNSCYAGNHTRRNEQFRRKGSGVSSRISKQSSRVYTPRGKVELEPPLMGSRDRLRRHG